MAAIPKTVLPFGYIVEGQAPKHEWMSMAITPEMKRFFRFSHMWDQYHFVSVPCAAQTPLSICFFTDKKNAEIVFFEQSTSFCLSFAHSSTFFRLTPGATANFVIGSIVAETTTPLVPPTFDDNSVSEQTQTPPSSSSSSSSSAPPQQPKADPKPPSSSSSSHEGGSLAQIVANCNNREAVVKALRSHLMKAPRDLFTSHINTVERLFKLNKRYHSDLHDCLIWIEQQYTPYLTATQIQTIHESRARMSGEVEEALKGVKSTFVTQLKNISTRWEKFNKLPDRYQRLLGQAQASVAQLEQLILQKRDEISQWAPSPVFDNIKDHIEQFFTRIQTEMLDLIEDSSLIPHRRALNQKIGQISKDFSLLISPLSSSSS